MCEATDWEEGETLAFIGFPSQNTNAWMLPILVISMLQIAPFWHAESEYALDCHQGFKVFVKRMTSWPLSLFGIQSQLRPVEAKKNE